MYVQNTLNLWKFFWVDKVCRTSFDYAILFFQAFLYILPNSICISQKGNQHLSALWWFLSRLFCLMVYKSANQEPQDIFLLKLVTGIFPKISPTLPPTTVAHGANTQQHSVLHFKRLFYFVTGLLMNGFLSW